MYIVFLRRFLCPANQYPVIHQYWLLKKIIIPQTVKVSILMNCPASCPKVVKL
jgi:hypothetical protein